MTVAGVDYPRVAGDAIPLPNGRYVILNGNKARAHRLLPVGPDTPRCTHSPTHPPTSTNSPTACLAYACAHLRSHTHKPSHPFPGVHFYRHVRAERVCGLPCFQLPAAFGYHLRPRPASGHPLHRRRGTHQHHAPVSRGRCWGPWHERRPKGVQPCGALHTAAPVPALRTAIGGQHRVHCQRRRGRPAAPSVVACLPLPAAYAA